MADFLTDPLWYKDAVIYELHVRSFFDSDGDGYGDFAGMRAKLPYLEALGVNTLWLLPFLQSPLRDDGYDTADYYKILPVHGDLDAFKAFLDEAHARGMRVITELVLNHTSDQHPWFQEARDPSSPRHDWYVWSDTADKYRGVRIIFTDTEHSNWTWDAKARKYYWHRFFSHQPDLNFDNPEVRKAMEEVTFFWLDLGVDGLRLDAVPYLYEREGTSCENLPETIDYIVELRQAIERRYGPGKVLLAEANQWPEDTLPYFAGGRGVQMSFNFPIMPRLYLALQREHRRPIVEMLRLTDDIPDECQWAVFLRNHDELTLEMVTDEERDYLYNAYAADSRFRINVGIRRRLAPLLGGDRRRIELLNALLLSLRGSPILYYGDEIGMGDDPFLGDRNGVRTPMQWSPDKNGGFSRASAHRLFLPAIDRGPYSYEFVNAEDAEASPDSLLHFMRRMIASRRQHAQVFGRGSMEILEVENPSVLAFVRRHDDQAVLVVANLSRFAQSVFIPTDGLTGRRPVDLFGYTPFPPFSESPYHLTLGPHGFFWFRLDVVPETASEPEPVPAEAAPELPVLRIDEGLHELLVPTMARSGGIAALEALLPDYLPRQRWYGHKDAGRPSVHLHDAVRIQRTPFPVYLAQLDVKAGGIKERYLLPLLLLPQAQAEAQREELGAAPIAWVKSPQERGLLLDGAAHPAFWQALVRWWQTGQKGRSLQGFYVPAYAGDPYSAGDVRVLRGDHSNSAAVVDGRLFIKLLRRLEAGPNPEAELLTHLTACGFGSAPRLHGTLAFQRPEGQTSLALALEAIEAEGDGWTHALALLARAFERATGQPVAEGPADALAEGLAPELTSFAGVLGVRVAEMHRAFARAEAGDLRPETPDPAHAEGLRDRVRAALDETRALLGTRSEGADVPLWERAEALLARIEGASLGSLIRIHGDLHLGQTLVAPPDVYLLDFEGEPARALAERRARDSALRDVAGMLRSFDYAVQKAAREHPDAEAWAGPLGQGMQQAFLEAYYGVAGIGEVLPPVECRDLFLRLYVLEKALYEVRYELGNRPDWVWLPLRALGDALGP
ncbi:MAG TPA: maltose alpha-D-glucosyltransferase [Rhodothermales bacterium]|nr:maltose alpha-D-glucosyltransferase [Rhodothermales bacterium]